MSRLALIFVAAVGASACVAAHQLSRADTDKVQKVALIGFSGQMVLQPSDAEKKEIGDEAFQKVLAGIDVWLMPGRFLKQGIRVESMALGVLGGELKWQPVEARQSATFARALDEHPPEGPFASFLVRAPGLMTAGDAYNVSLSDRDQMMAELGVEALAIIELDVYRARQADEGPELVSIVARARIKLYAKGKRSPIWSDSDALGELAGPVNVTAWTVADDEQLDAAAQSALQKLIVRYRTPPRP